MTFNYSKLMTIFGQATNPNAAQLANSNQADILNIVGTYSGVDNIFNADELSKFSEFTGISVANLGSLLSGTGYKVESLNTSNQSQTGTGDKFTYEEFDDIDTSKLTNMNEKDFIAEAEKHKNDPEGSFWKNIYNAGAKNIYEKLNTDKVDGLSEDELEKLAKLDGNKDKISSKDLENFFLKNDVPMTTKAIKEAEKQYTNAPQATTGAPASDASPASIEAAKDNVTSKSIPDQITETEGNIQKTNSDLTAARKTNNDEINAKEQEINTLVLQTSANDELKVQYAEAEAAVVEINNTILADKNAITAKQTEITSTQGELTSAKAEKAALDSVKSLPGQEDKTAQQKSAIDGKIKELEAKLNQLNEEKQKLDEQLTKDEAEKTKREEAKNALQLQIEASMTSEQKTQLDNLKAEIDQIKQTDAANETQASENLATYNKTLTDLKTAEGTTKGISAGSTAAGIDLAEYAKQVAASMGSSGWCLKGVASAIYQLTGKWPASPTNDASGSVPWFQANKDSFTDITDQVKPEDIASLPPGTIVVYERTDSAQYGHIEVRLGPGQACSDNFHTYPYDPATGTFKYLGKPVYHVFVPISEKSQ